MLESHLCRSKAQERLWTAPCAAAYACHRQCTNFISLQDGAEDWLATVYHLQETAWRRRSTRMVVTQCTPGLWPCTRPEICGDRHGHYNIPWFSLLGRWAIFQNLHVSSEGLPHCPKNLPDPRSTGKPNVQNSRGLRKDDYVGDL